MKNPQPPEERKKAFEAETAHLRKLKRLSQWSLMLSGDPADLFAHVVEMIGELFNVRVVCLSEIVGTELFFKVVYVNGQIFRDAGRCPLDITPCATVEESKDLRIYDRVQERFPHAPFLRDHNAFSYCGFPSLDDEGRVVAVTCLLDDKPVEFSDEDQQILRVIGQRLAMELKRSKSLTAHRRTEEQLHQLSSAVRQCADHVIITDCDGVIEYVNDAFEKGTGYCKGEALGETPRILKSGEHPAEFYENLWCAIRAGQVFRAEFINRKKNRELYYEEKTITPIRNTQGSITHFVSVGRDITERKRTEAVLASRAVQQAVVAELGQLALADTGLRQLFDQAMARVAEAFGVEYCKVLELLPGGSALKLVAGVGWQEGMVGQAIVGVERDSQAGYTLLSKDPVIVEDLRTETRFSGPNLLRSHGVVSGLSVIIGKIENPFGVLGAHTARQRTFTTDDVHFFQSIANVLAEAIRRKRTDQALRASEERFAKAFRNSPDSIALTTLDEGRILDVNESYCRLFGYGREELIGRTVLELDLWAEPQARAQHVQQLVEYGRSLDFDATFKTRTGEIRFVRISAEIIELGMQEVILGITRDITESKRAEEELRASEERFAAAFRANPAGVCLSTFDEGRFIDANGAFLSILGLTRDEVIGHTALELGLFQSPEDRQRIVEAVQRMGSIRDLEVPFTRRDGTVGYTSRSVERIRVDSQDCLLTVVMDITERKRVEEALRTSQERFRELAENIEDVFWIADLAKNRMLYVSPAYEKIWDRTCQSLYDEPRSWLDVIHPDDRMHVLHAVATRQIEGTYNEEYRIVRRDGQVRWIRDQAFPVRNAAGQVERIVGVARDITESRQLEEQFRQSQKMEGIGQLAGGVAHDFNNILAAIMMQSEMVGLVEDVPDQVQDGLRDIRVYAERAANLTRQLLLFSRRQVMQPRELNLNELVTDLARMLQRIIGEDVQLQLHLHSAPLMTRADAGMLDQVLLNLAVNARDAMPGGGCLLVETSERTVDEGFARLRPDAAPGRYVCLSVSDTGGGIPPDVLPRIFEPFFTTKEPGKGTGLGLATVYGIVKQHQGWLKVDSEPGRGANFQIYFPALLATAETITRTAPKPKPRGGTETILLAEDDSSVRSLTRMVLELHGYKVLETANGVQALQAWQDHRSGVALLLTDLVMPGGMSGQQLARRLQEDEPHLKVIFTSGYSADIAGRELQLRSGENFVQKPFAPHQLLEIVRRCLDG